MENNEKVYSLSELKEAFNNKTVGDTGTHTFESWVQEEWGIDVDSIIDEENYSFTF